MLSKNGYLRFAVSALILLSCLGFETATAQTNRRMKNQQQPLQTQADTKVMNLLSPEAQKYLSPEDNVESEGEIVQAKHYDCYKARHRKVRHYRVYHRRNYRCPCPGYHHRPVRYPQKVYHYHYHYYKVHPRKAYRHGVPHNGNFYRY
ncbi:MULTISPECIES: hypothetical protein [Nostocales]|uniref:Uncharacterized protein n=3 Tax=Nostocales TaxID=1161 RepID=A0A8S9TAF3_9CYAN|nr:hypothetical protein [Tolypothrix bouteillei]KAF3888564.1 hypothetical protein DA73_0400026125 [Tolypothrix bouteillei VB521301]